MFNKIKRVCILTRIPVNGHQFHEVAWQVKSIRGVMSFQQVPDKPGLIVVIYNTAQIQAVNIINKIMRLGFNASIVADCGEPAC